MFGLYERDWSKSLKAIVVLLVVVVGLVTAFNAFYRHDAAPVAEISAPVSEPVVEKGPVIEADTREPRALTSMYKQQLLKKLSEDAVVTVVAVREDKEAEKYAREIFKYLKATGYNVSLAFTAMPPSFHGADIDVQGDRAFVKIGRR